MTPSGFAYAVAARDAILPELDPPPEAMPRSYAELPLLLAGALRAAAPVEREPYLVVLTDCPTTPPHWEHEWAAERDRRAAGRAGRPAPGRRPRCGMASTPSTSSTGARTPTCSTRDVGRLLEPAMRAGTLGVVNAFGCGVGDDKLTHAYVEDMVRFYLGRGAADPRSVPTLDLGRPDHLEQALDSFDELVIKPRAGQRRHGRAWSAPHAEPDEIEAHPRAGARFTARLGSSAVRGAFAAPDAGRRRALAAARRPATVRVHAGPGRRAGAARRADPVRASSEGAMVVNTSQNGGFKDTWVVPCGP